MKMQNNHSTRTCIPGRVFFFKCSVARCRCFKIQEGRQVQTLPLVNMYVLVVKYGNVFAPCLNMQLYEFLLLIFSYITPSNERKIKQTRVQRKQQVGNQQKPIT